MKHNTRQALPNIQDTGSNIQDTGSNIQDTGMKMLENPYNFGLGGRERQSIADVDAINSQKAISSEEKMAQEGNLKGLGRMNSTQRTMAIWAYVGVFAGTLALYKYLDVLNKDKKKLLIGYGIVFAGLAAGSAIGAYRVAQKSDN